MFGRPFSPEPQAVKEQVMSGNENSKKSDAASSDEREAAPRPVAPRGVGSGLQPGGTIPGGGPGTTTGSIGTEGESSGGSATGEKANDPTADRH